MNPFERYDIDPMQGTAAITERFRELAEEADDAERDALRAVWEELTMHPRRRLAVALEAFPETRAPLSPRPPAAPPRDETPLELELRDLVVVPRVARALGENTEAPPALLAPLELDPFIDPPKTTK